MGPMFRNLAKPYLQRVTHDLRGLKVLHICGRTEKILSDMADAGFDGLSIEVDDVAKARSIVGGVRILGTVSSQRTLFSGKPEEVKQESVRALESGVDLLEPNCGVPPTAPLANVIAMVEARNEYYGSKTSTK
jgi:[methyl-Co(III) methanol-specific corrinoid protein]:coenzyme M methyltransferase